MKFKIEVDVDWIDPETGIDETIKQELANHILANVEKKAIQDIKGKIDKVASDKVSALVEEQYKSFMDRAVNVTDDWGNVTQKYTSINALIEYKFDKFLTEHVNDQGQVSSYSANYTRIEYLINVQLAKLSKDFTKTALEQITTKIKETLSSELKTAMGDKLMNVMEIDKMITKQLKN